MVTYGAYGDGTGKNAELCGVGEMWGYFMGEVLKQENYNKTTEIDQTFKDNPIDGWIYPHIFWDIYKRKLALKIQIYDCLREDTYLGVANELCYKNPDKATEIMQIFKEYITDFQTEPDYDVVLENLTIATYTTYYGKDVLLKNVNVTSGEKLVINCLNSTVIKDSFIAEKGSEFEIN